MSKYPNLISITSNHSSKTYSNNLSISLISKCLKFLSSLKLSLKCHFSNSLRCQRIQAWIIKWADQGTKIRMSSWRKRKITMNLCNFSNLKYHLQKLRLLNQVQCSSILMVTCNNSSQSQIKPLVEGKIKIQYKCMDKIGNNSNLTIQWVCLKTSTKTLTINLNLLS